eukprot:3035774-Rhodomonas_salina.6
MNKKALTSVVLLLALTLCSALPAHPKRPVFRGLSRRDLLLGVLANASTAGSAGVPVENNTNEADTNEVNTNEANNNEANNNESNGNSTAEPPKSPAPSPDISISFRGSQQAQQVQQSQQQIASSPEGSAPFAGVPALQISLGNVMGPLPGAAPIDMDTAKDAERVSAESPTPPSETPTAHSYSEGKPAP